ncbi:MAG TPA: GNAT family N-acetyltransferase [Stellaceae bacterium]|nr:GNAT family N-acetyltransferase [Stellaceae bacterium]
MAAIRPLATRDLAEVQRVIRVAFGTFLGVPDPEKFLGDLDYAAGRFGAEHVAAFVAEEDGVLLGSNFATRWGSVGFFGPLTTRPDRWNGGVGQQLVAAACDAFEEWGVSHAGLFTFADSAKHAWTYGKFGFYPRFLTAIMAAPAPHAAAAGANPAAGWRWTRYWGLPAGQRREAEAKARQLAEEIYPGLDLRDEIRTVLARNLGNTVLLWDGDSRLAGFAICHWGPASEAGAGCCYIKFGAVRPGSGAAERFAALLDACGELAAAVHMPTVLAGVNLAREEAYRIMLARGFRTRIQGVAMHRRNEPGYSRPGLFVIDDWR